MHFLLLLALGFLIFPLLFRLLLSWSTVCCCPLLATLWKLFLTNALKQTWVGVLRTFQLEIWQFILGNKGGAEVISLWICFINAHLKGYLWFSRALKGEWRAKVWELDIFLSFQKTSLNKWKLFPVKCMFLCHRGVQTVFWWKLMR